MGNVNWSGWALAVAVVGAAMGMGYLVGKNHGHPAIGAAVGLAAGMSVNYARGCPVCLPHVNALLGRPS